MRFIKGLLQNATSIAAAAGLKLDAVCFSCNGSVRRITTGVNAGMPGEAVMGVGTARWAAKQFSGLAALLGQLITHRQGSCRIFVVKSNTLGFDRVGIMTKNTWHQQNDGGVPLEQIEECLKQLVAEADKQGWQGIVLPMIGTGSAQLPASKVKKLMKQYLDDRFIVLQLENEHPSNVAVL